MKVQLRRSNNVDGKTVVMFAFDGYEAGTLEIPWACWQIWQKSLLKGMAASDVPFETEITGWTLVDGVPVHAVPSAGVAAHLPKPREAAQARENDEDSDALADQIVLGARAARLPKVPETRPTSPASQASSQAASVASRVRVEAAALEAAFLETGRLVPFDDLSAPVAETQHRDDQTQ